MEWQDKSISIFAVTIAMIILPLIVVPLRCYVRITRRAFKIDDWLIIAALLFHLGACAVTLWGFMHGLGMPDKVLSPENQIKGVQVCSNKPMGHGSKVRGIDANKFKRPLQCTSQSTHWQHA